MKVYRVFLKKEMYTQQGSSCTGMMMGVLAHGLVVVQCHPVDRSRGIIYFEMHII